MRDKVALVTGASSGIGRAIALELASNGARVMAAGRREGPLQELSQQPGIDYVVADLETEYGCEWTVEQARARLGPIEILVNNAGVGSAEERSVLQTSSLAWRRSMAVNLDAPFHLTRFAGKDMVARGWGRIVMVSSTAGELGARDMPAYCASKHGLLGLMRAAAVDLAPHGVTCNAVLPGWVRTEMAERSAIAESSTLGIDVEQVWARRAASYPAGRLVTPEEVARAVGLLCSDKASGVSGQAVTVALGGVW